MNNLSILPNNIADDSPAAPPPLPKWAVVEALAKSPTYTNVKVVDFHMSFGNMVTFMVKFSFATIPAALIIIMFWVLGVAILRLL
jgi:hypothetical protein